jgi:hypothetical protein
MTMSTGFTRATVKALPRMRLARFDDYSRIQRLEASNGLLSLEEREWRGLWLDNPLRQRLGGGWPIGWVLEDETGTMVGSLANLPTLFTFGGRELIAATGRGWVVSPQYRGMALWLMDEYFNQDGVDLFINTTVNSLAQEAFGSFGSIRVPLGDWVSAAYWVTGHRGFAAMALRIKGMPMAELLSQPAGAALWVKDAITRRPLPAAPFAAEIAETDQFDLRFDAFWKQLVQRNPDKLLAVRDRQTLSWHFAGVLRSGRAWIFTATRNGLLRAYCILKRQDHPPSGLVRMRLVDYQTLDPETDFLPRLLRAALGRCKGKGIHVLEHVGCGLPKMHSFDRYAPFRRKLPAWPYFFKAADPTDEALLRRPESWDPSSFDGDASL